VANLPSGRYCLLSAAGPLLDISMAAYTGVNSGESYRSHEPGGWKQLFLNDLAALPRWRLSPRNSAPSICKGWAA
jgi:hypothetical protein